MLMLSATHNWWDADDFVCLREVRADTSSKDVDLDVLQAAIDLGHRGNKFLRDRASRRVAVKRLYQRHPVNTLCQEGVGRCSAVMGALFILFILYQIFSKPQPRAHAARIKSRTRAAVVRVVRADKADRAQVKDSTVTISPTSRRCSVVASSDKAGKEGDCASKDHAVDTSNYENSHSSKGLAFSLPVPSIGVFGVRGHVRYLRAIIHQHLLMSGDVELNPGPLDDVEQILSTVDDTTFGIDDWNIVMIECSTLAAKWQYLCGYLGLPVGLIDSIKRDNPNDNSACWSDALKQWIQQNYNTARFGVPSWRRLLDAIARENRPLFGTLAEKYQASGQDDKMRGIPETVISKDSEDQSSSTQTPVEEVGYIVPTIRSPAFVSGSYVHHAKSDAEDKRRYKKLADSFTAKAEEKTELSKIQTKQLPKEIEGDIAEGKLVCITEDRARKVLQRNVRHLLDKYDDVTAVDIGYRNKKGVVKDEVCVVVWVEKKLPKSLLKSDQVLPEEIEGVPVDVVEGEVVYIMDTGHGLGGASGAAKDSEACAPLKSNQLKRGDFLIAHVPTRATLGCYAKRNSDQAIGIISAGHFMPEEGIKIQVESKVNPEDYVDVATVTKTSYDDEQAICDCGFAVLDGKVTEREVQKYATVRGIADCRIGDEVYFHGGTSQVVNCSIESTTFNCKIRLPYTNTKHRYIQQIFLSKKSQPGDSGALLIKKADNKAVGLVFAHGKRKSDGLVGGMACPIGEVQEFLDVTLITKS